MDKIDKEARVKPVNIYLAFCIIKTIENLEEVRL